MTALLGRKALAIIAALFALSLAVPASAYHTNGTHEFADPAFLERGERTDRPVDEDVVDRTWMWGPEPYTEGMMEPYADSPDGERLVQYFDKARMEINDPTADPNELWYVTNGLLVVEMVEGKFQIGDDEFDWSPEPAGVRIAGDPGDEFGPTYADIHSFELQDVEAREPGTVIDEYLAMVSIEASDEYAAYGVTAAAYVPETDHTVADVFWEFMNSEDRVFQDGEFVTDRLFLNPFYASGYPITEAYWATVQVEDEPRDVLWQCFERRCLTFTPGNEPGWEVEAGNVGQHYYEWRYRIHAPETETAVIYLVDMEDPDAGIPYELEGESLVPVEVEIPAQETVEGRIAASLEVLFTYEHEELHNEWTSGETDVTVESVTMTEGLATVHLSGEVIPVGTLSAPRLAAQLEHTAMQFGEVDQAVGLLNGGPIVEPAALPIEGVLAIFDVNGEQFRVWVTNEETIDQLYALQAGDSEANIPIGPIYHGSSPENEPPYNHPWSWHLDPELTEMAEVTIEVCDGAPSFVEAEVDYFVETVERYCPWGAELVEIIELDGM